MVFRDFIGLVGLRVSEGLGLVFLRGLSLGFGFWIQGLGFRVFLGFTI